MARITRNATHFGGTWPIEMRAETAAAYCDEDKLEAFIELEGLRSLAVRFAKDAAPYVHPRPRAITPPVSADRLTKNVNPFADRLDEISKRFSST